MRLSSPFILDLRSVALLRILLGSAMLYDILARFRFVELFLTDDGGLSRIDLLATVNRPWSFSLYMIAGESGQVQVILALHAAAAIALLLGLYTRFASIICWALLVSLQHRNPLVLNGGDTLIALYAFWAMFLPLNARWSLDRLLARKGEGASLDLLKENEYHAIPGAAFMLQTVFVYAFAVLLKSGELWMNGQAVGYAIRNLGMMESGGLWFQQFEWAHPLSTYVTYHWEWVGCLLLLCPFANRILKMIAVLGFVAMHVVFEFMMDLALFPFISITGWLALLPSTFWDSALARKWSVGLRTRMDQTTRWVRETKARGGPLIVPGRPSSIMCGLAIILVLVWNVRGLPNSPLRNAIPEPMVNLMYTLKLRQKWSMFAANPPRYSGWYTIEAQMADGDTIDLFYPNVPYTIRRPAIFTDRYPDRRWGKFLDNLRKDQYRSLRDDFLQYFIKRWSRRAWDRGKIETVELVYFREKIRLDGTISDPDQRTLATIHPSGVTQIVISASDDFDNSQGDLELGDL